MAIKNVIIINDFGYVQGGASKVAIDTANLLAEQSYNVYFFTGKQQDEKKELFHKQVAIVSTSQPEALHDSNKLRGIKNGLYNKKAYQSLTALLNTLDRNETIVHIHGWTKILSSSVFQACFDLKFKTVLTLHDYFTACPNGGFFNYPENHICPLRAMGEECIKTNCDSRNYAYKLYRLWRQKIQNDIGVLDKIENVIYISDLQWSVLKEYFSNLKHATQIPNPIIIKSDEKASRNPNGPYIFIGRLSKEKGIIEFCKGVTLANVPAIVAGDGPLLQKLESQYKNIQFTGWQSQNQVTNLMLKAKCLIFSSLWYEGQPLIPMEAASLGLPCILSDKSSAKEFVKTKYIYDGSNVESLHAIILDFEKNYSSLEIAPQKFSHNYINRLKSFYTEASQ